MEYDLCITPAQLKAAADWVEGDIDEPADVELALDDRMLVVEQGDARTAFDTGGEVGSESYLARAILDPVGSAGRLDPRLVNSETNPRGVEHDIVEFARLGSALGAEHVVDVRNRATFHAIMSAVRGCNAFDPVRCRDTIGDLFEGSMNVRVGHNGVGPIIEADFAFYAYQTIGNRGGAHNLPRIPLEERVHFAKLWMAWAQDMRADAVGVRQAYRGREQEVKYGKPGSDPVGIRLWWD